MIRKAVLLCALVALSTLALVRSDDSFDDSDVVVLTEENFDSIVKGEELMLVEFYAPWCGHCKHLKPEYGKAATDLKAQGVKLGKVDATVHGALAGKYKVNGYPKLFVFRNGRESDYNGPREHKGIVSYMQKQIGPAAKPLATEQDLKNFLKLDADRDFVVVGFFDKAHAKSQLHSAFLLVSARMRDDTYFGFVSDPAVAASAGVDLTTDKEGAVVAFKSYDDRKTVYSGSTATAKLQEWIQTQSFPLVGDYTKTRAERYYKRQLPILKYYTGTSRSVESNAKQLTYIMNRLEPVAREHTGKLLVALASPIEYSQEMSELGWAGKKEGLVIVNADGKRKYRFEQPFKLDNIKAFVNDYFEGKATVWVKSDPVPASNDGPVKVVVGKTFNEIVNDPSKDVLIEFYAPWCGHCKSLAPKYDKLGKKFKGVDSVVIAKLDATTNDYSPEYQVNGFPTIYFKPAGGKPQMYEGDREVDAFVSYIKKHSKTKWSFKKKKNKD